MKISKRVREEAALLCAMAASTDWSYWDQAEGKSPIQPLGPIPDRNTEAGALAFAAERVCWAVWRKSPLWSSEAHWAEAEALLRTGWTP